MLPSALFLTSCAEDDDVRAIEEEEEDQSHHTPGIQSRLKRVARNIENVTMIQVTAPKGGDREFVWAQKLNVEWPLRWCSRRREP